VNVACILRFSGTNGAAAVLLSHRKHTCGGHILGAPLLRRVHHPRAGDVRSACRPPIPCQSDRGDRPRGRPSSRAHLRTCSHPYASYGVARRSLARSGANKFRLARPRQGARAATSDVTLSLRVP